MSAEALFPVEARTLELYDWQEEAVEALRAHIRDGVRNILLVSPTGSGKCHGRDTPILMADGTVRMVQDVEVGDRLLGPDGEPRTVVALGRGREMMYRVTPRKGDPYVVNESHIMSLRKTGPDGMILANGSRIEREADVVALPLRAWLDSNPTVRHCLKGWRADAIDFPDAEAAQLPVPPYVLGAWLGDGSELLAAISKPDCGMIREWVAYCESQGVGVRVEMNGTCPTYYASRGRSGGRPNPVLDALRAAGVIGSKHVPNAYRTAPVAARLELLAGMLDSDGHMSGGGYDWITKDKMLADGFAFVARSLGFACYISECEKGIRDKGFVGTYWRCSLSGDTDRIPCRDKSAPPRRQKKRHLVHGIRVEPIGEGEYFGFEIDGDHLYLLGDFTVCHNTVIATHLIDECYRKGKRAVFVCDRISLITQTSDTFDEYGISHGVIQADHWRTDAYHKIQVASAQTLVKRGWPEAELIIPDEAHSLYKTTTDRISKRDTVTIGLSVGPDSTVELRGGMFRDGFVGRIEDAFSIAAAERDARQDRWNGFDRLDLEGAGVETRGWSGTGFCWRPLKRMLRHAGDRGYRSLRVRGVELGVTDDHSVFLAEPGEIVSRSRGDRRPRRRPILNAVPSAALAVGDLLAADDGANWGGAIERKVDVIEMVANEPGMQVVVDVSGISLDTWRAYGVTGQECYNRRKQNRGLPITLYRRMRHVLPQPTAVRHEKSRNADVDPTIFASEWAYMLGFWLGDGWMTRGEPGRIAFAVERGIADQFRAMLRALPGVRWNVTTREMPHGSVEVRVNNVVAKTVLERLVGDVGAQTKNVPAEWLISWPPEARRALLSGLVDSDGHRSVRTRNRDRTYYATTSPELARSILALLRSLGIPGSIHTSAAQAGGVVAGRQIMGRHPKFAVHWSTHAEAGTNKGKRGARTRFSHDVIEFHEAGIAAITVQPPPRFVYDFEMDGGHPSFVANGVLVHNTATPFTKGLGRLYDAVVTVRTLNQLTRDGYLAPFDVWAASEPDMTGAKTVAGEWTEAAAAERAMPIIGDAVSEYLEKAAGKKFIAFGVNVAHCEELQKQFLAAGVRCGLYTYKTDDEERKRMIEEFKNPHGYLDGLISVAALSKGFDAPCVECIIMCRPLRSSLAEHIQILGRGLRRDPDNPSKRCIVLDLAGNMMRFWRQMHDFFEHGARELDDGKRKPKEKTEAKEPAPIKCPKCANVHKPRPTCPNCGHEYPRRSGIEHLPGKLVAMGTGAMEDVGDLRRDVFAQLRYIAQERGYKLGWAAHQFEKLFGDFSSDLWNIDPQQPTAKTQNWVRAQAIRYAKGRAKGGQSQPENNVAPRKDANTPDVAEVSRTTMYNWGRRIR